MDAAALFHFLRIHDPQTESVDVHDDDTERSFGTVTEDIGRFGRPNSSAAQPADRRISQTIFLN
ncbi:MAG: hypothetical protein MZV49_13470 [Rhodopseudomonas palustris]|nr:hypothetical protein [Rhodopseudomonas palustris]